MNAQRTLLEDLKHQFRFGGMTMRLLFINVAIFLVINVFLVFGKLVNAESSVLGFMGSIFYLETSLYGFITHPWGIVTSIFAHFSFLHLLFNMLMLYFSGRLFEQMFDSKRLLYTYMLGGIAGGLFEIIAHFLPALRESNTVIVGASGSIMAIFFAIAFHRPKMKIHLFGVFQIQLIVLAAIFFLVDFFALGSQSGTAHFAHIGGAILGMISVQGLLTGSNLITGAQNAVENFLKLFGKRKSPRMRVSKGDKRFVSDEEYNAQKLNEQEEINRILDKISKSGYESLTKREKDFLFNQSKK